MPIFVLSILHVFNIVIVVSILQIEKNLRFLKRLNNYAAHVVMARKCQNSNPGLSLILSLWPQFMYIGLKGKKEKEEGGKR